MKYAIIAFVTVFAAGSAVASDRVTDVDFLKANRCKGLATTLTGVVDTQALDSFIKAERSARTPVVMDRAAAEFDRAKREAKGVDRRDRLTGELTGSCQAYIGPAANVAKQ
jgi:hypothetical protein